MAGPSIRTRCSQSSKRQGCAPCSTSRTPSRFPQGHPLWSAPGVLAITSHQAGDSLAADRRSTQLAVEQLRAYAAGEPLRYIVAGNPN